MKASRTPRWPTWLWRTHRWLGAISCLGLLFWGLSGLTHPIMTRLQVLPASFTAPAAAPLPATMLPPSELLLRGGVTSVSGMRTVTLKMHPWWLVKDSDSRKGRLFEPTTAAATTDDEEDLAIELARHYCGDRLARVEAAQLLTEFDDEYRPTNRILPVWRVRFDRPDGLNVYIDTQQDLLVTMIDKRRAELSRLFEVGHRWALLSHSPSLRLSIMLALLSCALASACSGIYLFVAKRGSVGLRLRFRPVPRLHRRLGLIVSLTTLTFAVSGGLHLLAEKQDSGSPSSTATIFAASDLSAPSWEAIQSALAQHGTSGLRLIALHGKPAWVLQSGESTGPRAQVGILSQQAQTQVTGSTASATAATLRNPPRAAAGSGQTVLTVDSRGDIASADVANLAREVAQRNAQPSDGAVKSVELVTKFSQEYGFINKRLPVWRVQFDGVQSARLFVDPFTGVLAARVAERDFLEAAIFGNLHKWHFLDINKDVRDLLMSLFALGNACVGALGLWLLLGGRPRSNRLPARGQPST